MEAIVTALTTQMGEIGSSVSGILAATLPIALPIIGGTLVITKGTDIFKKILGKA